MWICVMFCQKENVKGTIHGRSLFTATKTIIKTTRKSENIDEKRENKL